MPVVSPRKQALKKLDRKIAKLRPLAIIPGILTFLVYLLDLRARIESERYWERPQTYRSTNYLSQTSHLFDTRPARHKRLFRMSINELDQIAQIFGTHEVFKQSKGRPQAPPKVQIACLVHRLAHGHDLGAIADLFGVSASTVEKYTHRSVVAITQDLGKYVNWPSVEERGFLTNRIQVHYGLPKCLGFIDGTHINLEQSPHKGREGAGSYHSRHDRYGLLIVAIVDDLKRFRYIQWGFSAAASDQRAQKRMRLQTHPADYFGDGEYVLGDSGFTATANVVPMYKKVTKLKQLRGRKAFFNFYAAKARVAVEHGFGILKARWTALRNLRMRLRKTKDEAMAHGLIQAAFVLHNLCVTTWKDYVTMEDIEAAREEDREAMERMEREQAKYSHMQDSEERRELLVIEMMALNPPEPPVEEWAI